MINLQTQYQEACPLQKCEQPTSHLLVPFHHFKQHFKSLKKYVLIAKT